MQCKEPYKEVNKKDEKWNREADDKDDGGEKAAGGLEGGEETHPVCA